MLKNSGESGHPCLVPDFRGNAFSCLPLRIMFAVGLLYMAFIMLSYVPSMPTFWRVFIINECWILSKTFSASIEMIWWFFIFQFVNILLFTCQVMSNSLQPMDCSTQGFPLLYHLLEFAETHVHRVSNAIQPSLPLSPPSPPALSPSQIQGLFQWVISSHQMAKVLELQLQIIPSNEYSGLISFRIVWFDLAIQGTLKSLFQHHNLKASILWCSAFLRIQLSHLYMTTGKTTALTIATFVDNWLYGPLSAKWCLCFLIHCLGL